MFRKKEPDNNKEQITGQPEHDMAETGNDCHNDGNDCHMEISDIVMELRLISKRMEMLEKEVEDLKSKTYPQSPCTPGGILLPTERDAVESLPNDEEARTIYLAAPSSDGVFTNFSDTEQIGKSIYLLVTTDNVNGTFSVLQTKDATATAVISISQFIKPACKIMNSQSVIPGRIITEEKGTATYDGAVWSINNKAKVRFEK